MYSYLRSEKALFSCDSFECHYSEGEKIFNGHLDIHPEGHVFIGYTSAYGY
ncbi:MAG: hypothetical protein KAX49_10855 [Halanaerobiales bacterium]|nr:hypothetical protein [Halanaerobiales bacterium]